MHLNDQLQCPRKQSLRITSLEMHYTKTVIGGVTLLNASMTLCTAQFHSADHVYRVKSYAGTSQLPTLHFSLR